MEPTIKAACAKQAGNLHLLNQLPCQDSVVIYRGNDACCLALADGAGSVPGSELASNAVCAALAREIGDSFRDWYAMENEALKTELLRLAAAAVEAAEPGRKPDCTLLLVSISIDGRVLWCHIGDGGIFYVFGDRRVLLSPPENGAEACLTFFLSGKEARKHLRMGRLQLSRNGSFLLCSDGVEPTLYDAETESCAAAVGIIADWLEKEPEDAVSDALAGHLNGIFREKTDDDLSLGVISYHCSADEGLSEEKRDSA